MQKINTDLYMYIGFESIVKRKLKYFFWNSIILHINLIYRLYRRTFLCKTLLKRICILFQPCSNQTFINLQAICLVMIILFIKKNIKRKCQWFVNINWEFCRRRSSFMSAFFFAYWIIFTWITWNFWFESLINNV